MEIEIIGPKDGRVGRRGRLVDATSRSEEAWSRGLSPFHLGPCPLYGGRVAARMENAHQFSKLYARHADDSGEPTQAYWDWAASGWRDPFAHRYPMGRGARPLCALWDGERLDYAAGRRRIYWPLYRDAVAGTEAFAELARLAAAGPLTLFDFDGYSGCGIGDALADLTRPMGHAFVLKAMLERGPAADPGWFEPGGPRPGSSRRSA